MTEETELVDIWEALLKIAEELKKIIDGEKLR